MSDVLISYKSCQDVSYWYFHFFNFKSKFKSLQSLSNGARMSLKLIVLTQTVYDLVCDILMVFLVTIVTRMTFKLCVEVQIFKEMWPGNTKFRFFIFLVWQKGISRIVKDKTNCNMYKFPVACKKVGGQGEQQEVWVIVWVES